MRRHGARSQRQINFLCGDFPIGESALTPENTYRYASLPLLTFYRGKILDQVFNQNATVAATLIVTSKKENIKMF
jgi:hypothetical protein